MANIRISEGDDKVVCNACKEEVKSVYVFQLDTETDERELIDFPMCLKCLGKAAKMLSAIEGVQNPVQQVNHVYQQQYMGEAPMPRVVPTQDVDRFHQMMDEGNSGDVYKNKSQGNGSQVRMPDWAREIDHALKETMEEHQGLPASEVKKVLEEIGITERMNAYPFLMIARKYGIADLQAKSMWNSVLANKKINSRGDDA